MTIIFSALSTVSSLCAITIDVWNAKSFSVASSIDDSDSISKFAVASSKTIIFLFAKTALNKATNCLSPADIFPPRSPTSWSNFFSYLSNQSRTPIDASSYSNEVTSGCE